MPIYKHEIFHLKLNKGDAIMKKLLSLVVLGIMVCSTGLFALNYGGFMTDFSITSVQNLGLPGHVAMDPTAGIGKGTFTVQCNYDNWHVVAYGTSFTNATFNYTIPATIAQVTSGAATPSVFVALPTTLNACPNIATGNYCGVTPASYDLYFKIDTASSQYLNRRAGYYGTYINLQINNNLR